MFAGYGRGLKQCVFPVRDGRRMENRIPFDHTVIAQKFAVWPFRLYMAALVQITLDDILGVGRNPYIRRHTFNDWQGRATELGDKIQFVHRQAHNRRHMVTGMRADGKCHGQFFTLCC